MKIDTSKLERHEKMQITFNIRACTDMGGGRSVEVAVENMNAQSCEMGFAKGLVESVEKFANDYGKGEEK